MVNLCHNGDIFKLLCADNLFGVCQRSHGHVDNYRYHLNGAQLSELYDVILKLVADGYTWHHRHTQCVLYEALLRYRHGSMLSSTPSVCADSNLRGGLFEAELMNSSQLRIQQMSPNVKTGLHRKHYGAFGEFQNFMQGLQAEDLFALKKFLLKDSLYKRPVSVKAVPGVTKASVMDDDHPGTAILF